MPLEKQSPCKVNLILNILGRRADGFHELETIMQPVRLCDELSFSRTASGIELSCNDATLPVDGRNLVHRAATAFLQTAAIHDGVKFISRKKSPWPPAWAAAAGMPPPPCWA
jgi:4-diphosphocytidyl-2-C-methyl-D-erythritol kinase